MLSDLGLAKAAAREIALHGIDAIDAEEEETVQSEAPTLSEERRKCANERRGYEDWLG